MWEDILQRKDKIEYPTQYVLLGQAYLIKGNFNKAIKAYQQALMMKPKWPEAQLFIANAWFKKAVNSTNVADRDRDKWLHKALIHYNKAESLSSHSIIGDGARRQMKEVDKNIKNCFKNDN